MHNRYINGLLSGLGGGIAATVVNLSLIELLNFGNLRFADFSGVFVFGRIPQGFWETILAFLISFGFYATLGVFFTFLISRGSERYLLIKGAHYGIGVWFLSYTIAVLYKIPQLEKASLESAVANFAASLSFGLATARILLWLIRKKDV